MRILMVLESDFPPDVRVENEIETLLHAGHEVHIACFSHRKKMVVPKDTPYHLHKKHISRLRYKSSVGALKFGYYFRFWRRFLKQILAGNTIDVIHVHDLPLTKIGVELAAKYSLKLIIDLHENWAALLKISTHTQTFLGKLLCSISRWERYEAKYLIQADKVIVVVEEMKARIMKQGVPANQISVVSNTLNLKIFNFPKPSRNPEYITMVYGGGVNYHRGLQVVIRAIPLIKEKLPNIRLWIVGGGSYLEQLKTEAKLLGVTSHITFWGWKKQDELLKLISQGDIALIPFLRSPQTDAGAPHKLFQYMYAGIPIIASDCLPLARILKETETGVCFRDRDPDSFSEELIGLISNKSFMERIPENGRKWIQNKYNWNRDGEVLTDLYTKLGSLKVR